jgi:catechol 2,3-dioxygenase-like lactoylglutathione lyase family enzyme
MWKTLIALAFSVSCCAQTSLVKGVGNFIHDVSNLDDSVHFYRDVLGMEAPRPPGDWQTTEGVLKMYGAVGGKFRVANAQVTGVAMRIELVEFQGVDRKPVRRALGEPGASLLILTVADLQPVLDRLKAANWRLAVKLTEACDGRGIATADPDGFPVLVVQRKSNAEPPPAAGKNFIGLRFGYTVSDDAVLNGPFRALSLAGVPSADTCQPVEQAILKTSAATIIRLPDGFPVMLVRSTRGKKSAGAARPQDPGAAVLRLAVTDAEAAVRALGQAGIKVVSEGGAIQTLPPAGLRATILWAPDNLFIQVVQ